MSDDIETIALTCDKSAKFIQMQMLEMVTSEENELDPKDTNIAIGAVLGMLVAGTPPHIFEMIVRDVVGQMRFQRQIMREAMGVAPDPDDADGKEQELKEHILGLAACSDLDARRALMAMASATGLFAATFKKAQDDEVIDAIVNRIKEKRDGLREGFEELRAKEDPNRVVFGKHRG